MIVEDLRTDGKLSPQISRVFIYAGVRAITTTPLLSSTGNVLGIVSTLFDTPHRPGERELRLMDLLARQTADYLERKHAEKIQKTLIGEIQHRSNNLLAIIQAIAHRTFSSERSSSEAGKAFEARLQALARANQELIKSNWAGVNLKEIVRLELEPFAERTLIEGPDIQGRPSIGAEFLACPARTCNQRSQIWGAIGPKWKSWNPLDGYARSRKQQAEIEMARERGSTGYPADPPGIWHNVVQGSISRCPI